MQSHYLKASIILLTIGVTSSSIIQRDSAIGITSIKNQQIFLFEKDGCSSSAQYLFTNTSSVDAKVSSAFVSGMWQVRRCPKGSTADDSCDVTITVPITACKTFSSSSPIASDEQTTHVIRYGHEDTSMAELVVFSEGNFMGDSHLIPSEGVETISVASGMSYVFTGPLSWALYSEPDFTGEVTCLVPDETIKTNGYGISYTLNVRTPLSFKSARPGGACETEGETPTTTEDGSGTGGSSTFHTFSSVIYFIGLIATLFSAKM